MRRFSGIRPEGKTYALLSAVAGEACAGEEPGSFAHAPPVGLAARDRLPAPRRAGLALKREYIAQSACHVKKQVGG